MKPVILAAVALVLSGCQAEQLVRAQAKIDAIKAKTVQLCGLAPSAAMVAGMADKNAGATVDVVAAELCAWAASGRRIDV